MPTRVTWTYYIYMVHSLDYSETVQISDCVNSRQVDEKNEEIWRKRKVRFEYSCEHQVASHGLSFQFFTDDTHMYSVAGRRI